MKQKVQKISREEVRTAERMKSGKAVGSDDKPVAISRCLGDSPVHF